MSGDHSDGEGSVGYDADFVDTTEDREVELKFDIIFTWIKSRFTTIIPNVLLVTQLVWPSVVRVGIK